MLTQVTGRLSAREGLLTILIVQGVVNLLFTMDAAARGHGPKVSDIPAECLMFALICLVSFVLFWVIRAVDRTPIPVRLFVILMSCIACGSLFLPILHGVQYLLAPERGMAPWPPFTLRRIQVGTVPYLFTAAALMAAGFYKSVRESEAQLRRSHALSREAQLLALRYQIDPHFLFNALNSVSTLVLLRRNEAAEDMLRRLAGFFRLTLEQGGTATIPLGQELELQDAYLNVEKARFGDDITLEIDVPAELMDARVPGMILQPLVENAVKHGARSGLVAIRARSDPRGLIITVENSVANSATAQGVVGTNTGLRNVRERLKSSFGDRADLEIDQTKTGVYRVRLIIPGPNASAEMP